jgi:hypothetical protein
MHDRKVQLLVGILGQEGANALRKAVERSRELESVLVPRAILAWLGVAGRKDYAGNVPGVDGTEMRFIKSENGFTGSVKVDGRSIGFTEAGVFQLASAIAVAIGADQNPDDIKDIDLFRLGKSIDMLAKAHILANNLTKANKVAEGAGKPDPGWKPTAPPKPSAPEKQIGSPPPPTKSGALPPQMATQQQQPSKEPVLKPEFANGVHPFANVKPTKTTAKNEKVKLKVTKSEAKTPCSICGKTQFSNERFVGCLCFRDLAKYTTVIKSEKDFTITFKPEWDLESVEAFIETLRKR